ncbi:integrase arm-type DNA-binding domain-containing protein [Sphingomonas sp. S1-29]|uniref:tyrosine-type recombinase/integrase n=1 Tax=Sphingomonas sp. S1-29 TaxID=2991074 RepID=UPI002240B84C|nr:integrase arm-type DNA-binding domain-containing protein [Sphingomonas sp. S1-29]UZK70794.1 integrase arm-type DNA-binding domain-containing protein [Sphingomonas sp. S1-29]
MANKIPARPTNRFFTDLESRPKDYQMGDETVSNLFLTIRPTGVKRWNYDAANTCNMNSRRIKMSLGTYPAYGLAEAREWAEELNRLRGRGIDPRVAKVEAEAVQARKNANTMRAVHAKYIEFKSIEGVRTLDEKTRLLERNVFGQFGDRPITEFSKADGRACVQAMRGRGSYGAANRMLSELRTFLTWAAAEDHVEHNVALGILMTKEDNPRRALEMHELVWLWRALDSYPADQSDPVRMLILMGCRVMESHGAALSEVKRGIWTIPRGRAKNGKPCLLPLAPMAKSIFDGARERSFESQRGYFFHGAPYKGMAVPFLTVLRGDLDRMARQEGETVEPWDMHCIRHAVRTHIVNGDDTKKWLAELILNHSAGDADRRYDHGDYLESKLALLTSWEERLMKAVDGRAKIAA